MLLPVPGFAEWRSLGVHDDGQQVINGLVVPGERGGIAILNEDGRIPVSMEEGCAVGLMFREKGMERMLESRRLEVGGKEYDLPEVISLRVEFEDMAAAQRALDQGVASGGKIYAGYLAEHLPTAEEPWLAGPVVRIKRGRVLPRKFVEVDGRRIEVDTAGEKFYEQVVGMLGREAVVPYVNQASVYGRRVGNRFVAKEIALRPIPDQVAGDVAGLPRLLTIGDSVSMNYGPGLREALRGRFNVHRPPTNSGPARRGVRRAGIWLGDYEKPGRQWDVISFNAGHWDAVRTKEEYQADLVWLVEQLRKTGAKLLWVTSCPVPNGYPAAGELVGGRAPGRTAGVMEKYLNPWAMEVIGRYPEIAVSDLWQFVKNHEGGMFCRWWRGRNVHFKGRQAAALGEELAGHVARVYGSPRNGE